MEHTQEEGSSWVTVLKLVAHPALLSNFRELLVSQPQLYRAWVQHAGREMRHRRVPAATAATSLRECLWLAVFLFFFVVPGHCEDSLHRAEEGSQHTAAYLWRYNRQPCRVQERPTRRQRAVWSHSST